MTQPFSYPSDTFPAFPAVTIDAPDGWGPVHAPGSVLTVAEPAEAGSFRCNIVVAVTRFGADYELALAAKAVREKFASLDQANIIGEEDREVLGVPGFRIEASFAHPQVGTMAQATHIAVIRSGEYKDLVQLTGSAAGREAKEIWPRIQASLASARAGVDA